MVHIHSFRHYQFYWPINATLNVKAFISRIEIKMLGQLQKEWLLWSFTLMYCSKCVSCLQRAVLFCANMVNKEKELSTAI